MIEQTDTGRYLRLPDGTRLRFPQGMWEYRRETKRSAQRQLLAAGWRRVGPELFKWTYQP